MTAPTESQSRSDEALDSLVKWIELERHTDEALMEQVRQARLIETSPCKHWYVDCSQPVAWRYRLPKGTRWSLTDDPRGLMLQGWDVEPLFLHADKATLDLHSKSQTSAAPVSERGEWEACEWQLQGHGPYTPLQKDVRIRLMRSPFYKGDKYAVRCIGNCLSKDGKWEHEPMPSSRDDDFYARCRFDSFEEALAATKQFEGPG